MVCVREPGRAERGCVKAVLRFKKLTLVIPGGRVMYRDYFQGPWCCWRCSQRKNGSCEWFPVKFVSHVPVEEIENRHRKSC